MTQRSFGEDLQVSVPDDALLTSPHVQIAGAGERMRDGIGHWVITLVNRSQDVTEGYPVPR